MNSRRVLSLASLGLVFATVPIADAEAQRHARVIVCRDGTRISSNNASDCGHHRGVDGRATEEARRHEAEHIADSRRRDRRERRDDRWDDREARDPRYEDRRDRGRDDDDRYGYGRGEVYAWSGTVDREIHIQLRGDRAVVHGEDEDRSGRGRVLNGLPRREGTLVVRRLDGRGEVDVMEQPSARNGYTATLRIRDSKGGADHYRIVAFWQPSGNDRYGYDERRRYSGN